MDLQNLKSLLEAALQTSTESAVQSSIQDALTIVEAAENKDLEGLHNDAYESMNRLFDEAQKTDLASTGFHGFFQWGVWGVLKKKDLNYGEIKYTEA